jgi:glutathione S-transferase
MVFPYIDVEEAMKRPGLRMVVVGNVPSPWGEAAKGIFHIKGIEWAAVRMVYGNESLRESLRQWTGQQSGPVAIYNDEPPRGGWAEILLLAERLAPKPSLLPTDPAERALVFGISHEICGEAGLGWSRRLQLIHVGLQNAGGFPERVAEYLGGKYGYTPEAGVTSASRVAELLGMLATRLKAQSAQGSRFYVGNSLTAVDVYSATCMALFAPLPQEQCAMSGPIRAAFETFDAHTRAALDPILFRHRDMMYAEHLQTPLSL